MIHALQVYRCALVTKNGKKKFCVSAVSDNGKYTINNTCMGMHSNWKLGPFEYSTPTFDNLDDVVEYRCEMYGNPQKFKVLVRCADGTEVKLDDAPWLHTDEKGNLVTL